MSGHPVAGGAPLKDLPAPPASLFDVGGGRSPTTDTTPSTVLARFQVLGTPRPQGSKRSFVDGGGKVRTAESNATSHAHWRNAVADKAYELTQADPAGFPLDGPLAIEATFRFPCAVTRRKRAVNLGGTLPYISAPDLDKLLRAVLDALETAGLVANDARFTTVFATKLEVVDAWTGADITIRRLS